MSTMRVTRPSSSWSVLLLLLALPGCGVDEAPPNPLSRGRATYAGQATATLADAEASVDLRLDRFGMRIKDAKGAVLLDTVDDDPNVAGDDARAYGALGATHHETTFKISIVEGWDHV